MDNYKLSDFEINKLDLARHEEKYIDHKSAMEEMKWLISKLQKAEKSGFTTDSKESILQQAKLAIKQ